MTAPSRTTQIGRAQAGGGEVIVLNCGMMGTGHDLFHKAKGHGFNGCDATFRARLAAGIRDFSELIKPVDPDASRKSKRAYAKRRQDPEFQAALAAVAARRGPR